MFSCWWVRAARCCYARGRERKPRRCLTQLGRRCRRSRFRVDRITSGLDGRADCRIVVRDKTHPCNRRALLVESREELDEQLRDPLRLVVLNPVRRFRYTGHALEVRHVSTVGFSQLTAKVAATLTPNDKGRRPHWSDPAGRGNANRGCDRRTKPLQISALVRSSSQASPTVG
jgi:hypothetical protein